MKTRGHVSRVVAIAARIALASLIAAPAIGLGGLGGLAAGCGGPYKGKPEKLPKIKKKKEPEDAAAGDAAAEIAFDDECSAKFTEEPKKAPNSASKARPLVSAGDDAMSRAAVSDDPGVQIDSIIIAIEQYKKALLEDNYNADATYQLARAYAQVRKKGCAIKLLKRLAELKVNPRLASSKIVDDLMDQVEDDVAFRPFKNDAMQAIGR